MNYLAQLTDAQLNRQYIALKERIWRAFAGGTQFGIDLPALAAVTPGFYAALMAYRTEGKRRVAARA